MPLLVAEAEEEEDVPRQPPKVLAVWFSYGMHACTTYLDQTCHGGWPGAAAARIEARFPGSVALPAIGCSGDLASRDYLRIEADQVAGAFGDDANFAGYVGAMLAARNKSAGALCDVASRAVVGEEEEEDGPGYHRGAAAAIAVSTRVLHLPLDHAAARDPVHAWARVLRTHLDREGGPNAGEHDFSNLRQWPLLVQRTRLHRFFARFHLEHSIRRRNRPVTTLPYPITTVCFSSSTSGRNDDRVCVVFLAGEPVVDFAHLLRRRVAERDATTRLVVVGYSNAMPGYIASKKVVREGGYEAGEMPDQNSYLYYMLPGQLAEAAEAMIVEAVAEMVDEAQNRF